MKVYFQENFSLFIYIGRSPTARRSKKCGIELDGCNYFEKNIASNFLLCYDNEVALSTSVEKQTGAFARGSLI